MVNVLEVHDIRPRGVEPGLSCICDGVDRQGGVHQCDSLRHERSVSNDEGAAARLDFFSGEGLGRDLRTNAGGVAHCDRDDRFSFHRNSFLQSRIVLELYFSHTRLQPDEDGVSMTDYVTATWRLFCSEPADGPANMAIDEAILRAVAAEKVPPTLRLYAWEPPCLSLGRGQPQSDVDIQALQAAGYGLVRRPTGGRGILHIDELTYSVVAPESEPRVAGGIVESYRRLSTGIVRGLELLGVRDIVADQRVRNRNAHGPVCFEVPADYEITAGGRKLVGSAQMRSKGVVLQHGAVPLYGDISRICLYLTSHPDRDRVRARATTISGALGREVSWDEVAEAIQAGFADALALRFEPGELLPIEREWVSELQAEKYGTGEWMGRV